MALNTKEQVLTELHGALDAIDKKEVEAFEELILGAKRIFCVGYGRSGLCSRGFAMRLMHLGLSSNVVGEMTTPSIAANDLLIMTSASGSSGALLSMAEKSKKVGAKVASVTANPTSAVAKMSDAILQIHAQTKIDAASSSISPMGSLFEETVFITFDLITMDLMERLHITGDEMMQRHANLE